MQTETRYRHHALATTPRSYAACIAHGPDRARDPSSGEVSGVASTELNAPLEVHLEPSRDAVPPTSE
jgi:hypothetical protein